MTDAGGHAPGSVAVIVPCRDEATTVGTVVRDFRAALPSATIYVFDNASRDDTAVAASRAGAVVVREPRPGKGEVLRAALERVDADFYLVVDGDDTYPAEVAPGLLQPLFDDECDMVVGTRAASYHASSPRRFHAFGNWLVNALVNRIFRARLLDVMSGYRAFTRRVALSVPILSRGFDVETEMTVQLLYRRYRIREVPIVYRGRAKESASKLRTFADGWRILLKIFTLLVAYKPLTVFGSLSVASLAAAFVLAWTWFATGVFGAQTLTLLVAFVLLSVLFLSLGLTISSINWRVFETESHVLKLLGSRAPAPAITSARTNGLSRS